MRTALVTGATGFIGTWVMRELLRTGVRPVGYDRQANPQRWRTILGDSAQDTPLVLGELLDRERLMRVRDEWQVTHVIHLAALLTPQCQSDPWLGCEVNVLGSVAVFELLRTAPTPIQGCSYASSFAVYGPEVEEQASGAEASENRPPTFYGAYKKAVDLITDQYWRHFGVASVGIRPHVVYGPERDQGLTAGPSLAARAAARGAPAVIGYRGRVGYDYVEDVARAFVRAALETPRGAHLVDLPGELATSEEFVAAIDAAIPGAASQITISGPEIPPNIPPVPHYIANLFPDWRATPLREGVQRTIDFYRT